MAKGFPCPNPTCAHLFSPSDVAGAASVECPRCGTIFELRSSTPPAALANAGSSQATPKPPPARPAKGPAASSKPKPRTASPATNDKTEMMTSQSVARESSKPASKPGQPPTAPAKPAGTKAPPASPSASGSKTLSAGRPGPGPVVPSEKRTGKPAAPVLPALQASLPASEPEAASPTVAMPVSPVGSSPGVPLAAAVDQADVGTIPLASPIGAEDGPSELPDMTSAPPRKLVRRRQVKRKRNVLVLTTLVILVLTVVTLGSWGFYRLAIWFVAEVASQPSGPVHESDLYNYSFVFPDDPWRRDDSVKRDLRVNLLGMRRTDPNAWMALGGQDYKTRTPRDSEVVDEAVRKLRSYFQEPEYEQREDVELAGKRAQRLVFTGFDPNSVQMSGEAYLLTYNGFAYWFFTWAPIEHIQQVEEDFSALRKGFGLLKYREGWTERLPKPRPYPGTRAAYSLTDNQELWQKHDQPTDFDPEADLALEGKDRIESKDVDKMAQVLVLVLKAEDGQKPEAIARSYIVEQQKKLYDGTSVEVVKERGELREGPAKVGDVRGHVARLHVKNSDTRERFMILATVSRGEHIICIHCECDWKRRDLWDRDFAQLLDTFRLR